MYICLYIIKEEYEGCIKKFVWLTLKAVLSVWCKNSQQNSMVTVNKDSFQYSILKLSFNHDVYKPNEYSVVWKCLSYELKERTNIDQHLDMFFFLHVWPRKWNPWTKYSSSIKMHALQDSFKREFMLESILSTNTESSWLVWMAYWKIN